MTGSGSLGSADRLVLTSSLVPYLRARSGRATIAEAASRFRVPEEEIERAVRLIACSGSPGESGSYLDSDLFDIDWDALERDREIAVTRFVAIESAPALSADEVSAVLAGLQVLRRLPGLEPATEDRIDRIIALLRGRLPPVGAAPPEADDRIFRTVRTALEEERRLTFSYRSPASDEARREVDPISLDADDGAWYLRAWCHAREAERSFRLDRMRDAQLTGPAEAREPMNRGDRATAPAAREGAGQRELFRPDRDVLRVRLEADASALPLLRGFLDDSARPRTTGGVARVTVRIAHPAPLVRAIASAGGRIRVQEPAGVREAVIAWSRAALHEAEGA